MAQGMNLRTISNVAALVVQSGPRSALKTLAHRAYERYHERRLGISTCSVIQMRDLGIDDPQCREYVPISYRDFRFITRRIALGAGDDVFLDLGSGMGRVPAMAGE